MPDLGLPRVLARGERGSTRWEPLAGASFLGLGDGSAPHRRRASRACKRGFAPYVLRATCFWHAARFSFAIGLRGAIRDYNSSLMTRSMSSWRECTSSFA